MNDSIIGLCVCVNYDDILNVIAKNNLNVLDKIYVVTTSTDINTQEVCKKYNLDIIISDSCYENNAPFNKSKMINVGLREIYKKHEDSLYLLFDSDIYLQDDLKEKLKDVVITDDDILWGPRHIAPINTEEDKFPDIFKNKTNLYKEMYMGQGYFQLFKNKLFYDESYIDACASDTVFWRQFKNSILINDYIVIHIGEIARNWRGRITEKRIIESI